MKKIKWINQYDTEASNEGRIYFLSSTNKMDYICSALIENGWNIEIISPSITSYDKGYYKKSQKIINKNIKLTLFSTFGAKTKIGKALSKIYCIIQLFLYLILNIKKDEYIIVSHSLISAVPIYLAKKIKRFKLILDFGEEYNKIEKCNRIYQWIEPKIIQSSDKFIFANDIMGEIYGINPDNFIVIYGQYLNNIDTSVEKLNKIDCKIHIVYAGVISKKEKSAFRAIELSNYLDDNYIIHILGRIDEGSEQHFYSCIRKANENNNGKVVYEGVKMGKEYINQMMQYDIGLNLRSIDEKYIDFAFPSKILSYLNTGLRVVSSRIKCVEQSEIGSLLYYFDENNLRCISETIKNIDLQTPYNSLNKVKELDRKVKENIENLIH